jgi:hypothetical protein
MESSPVSSGLACGWDDDAQTAAAAFCFFQPCTLEACLKLASRHDRLIYGLGEVTYPGRVFLMENAWAS